jgi:U4/U6 small nuclear ribonucleoprotein PRP4
MRVFQFLLCESSINSLKSEIEASLKNYQITQMQQDNHQKQRIHYGSLENTLASNVVSSSSSNQQQQQQYMQLSNDALSAQQKRDHLLRELEIMNRAKTLLIPTDDHQVKMQLRSLGQPITYFGEGPGDRRDRLKLLLARSQVEQQQLQQIQQQQQQQIQYQTSGQQQQQEDEMEIDEDELLFIEGPDTVGEARSKIAQYSLHRAHERRKYQQNLYNQMKQQASQPQLLESEIQKYKKLMDDIHSYDVIGSEFADRRPVSSISVLPYRYMNKRVAITSAWSGNVKIWDIDAHNCLQVYKAHDLRIVHTQFSPLQSNDESISFATASSDKLVKLWRVTLNESSIERGMQDSKDIDLEEDVSTPNMEDDNAEIVAVPKKTRAVDSITSNSTINSSVTLSGHSDRLSRICYHGSGHYLASSSFDKTWRFWDITKETCLYEQKGHSSAVYAIVFHPDGSLCASSDLGGIIRVWDMRTGRTIIPLRAHVNQCLSIDFSPNGYNMASSSDDNAVKIWDLRRLKDVGDKPKSTHVIPAHIKLISRVQYEPTHGRFLTTSSYDRTIKIWDSLDYKPLNTLEGN